MLRIILLLACAVLFLPAADITLESSSGSGGSVVISMELTGAPAFATASGTIRFDNTKLSLTTQAAGTFATFIQDSRSLSDINASGEVRFGTFALADNAGGTGTLGVFTFSPLATGTTDVTSVVYSTAEPFGCMLQTSAGATIGVTLVDLPLAVNLPGGSNAAPVISAATASPTTVTGTQSTLAVTASDDGGEAGLMYTWSAQTVPAGGAVMFSPNAGNAAKAATATFTRAGSYVLRVTAADAGGLDDVEDVSVTVVQEQTTVVVTPATVTLATGATQIYAAEVRDQFAVALATQPAPTWSLDSGSAGSITTGGVYTAGASGSATVRATVGAISGIAAVSITGTVNTAPIIASVAAARDHLGDTEAALGVVASDNAGESGLTYTWSAPTVPTDGEVTFSPNASNGAKAATATFTGAGNYVLRVTVADAGGLNDVEDVSITVDQTATTVVVTPGTITLATGAAQTYAAEVRDQFAVALETQPTPTWSLDSGSAGSITTGGVYTAGASGSATVRATVGAISGTAVVSITGTVNTAPVIASATATPNPLGGTEAALAVVATDDGGESGLTYTWSVPTAPAGGTGVFSTNGTNAAKASTVTVDRVGTWVLRVTASDGSLTDVEDITLEVEATATAMVVSPATVNLTASASRAFTAEVLDQFAQPMGTPPAVTWTLDAGSAGSITTSGVYTAGSTGTATVRATAGSVTGVGAVSIGAVADQGGSGDDDDSKCGFGIFSAALVLFGLTRLLAGNRHGLG